MQVPLTVSQRLPAWQSAEESQRNFAWQKPAALQVSVEAQEESPVQRQAPVLSSQLKPAAHCVSLVQRPEEPFLQPLARSKAMTKSRFMGR
jgi:hypothetical protein